MSRLRPHLPTSTRSKKRSQQYQAATTGIIGGTKPASAPTHLQASCLSSPSSARSRSSPSKAPPATPKPTTFTASSSLLWRSGTLWHASLPRRPSAPPPAPRTPLSRILRCNHKQQTSSQSKHSSASFAILYIPFPIAISTPAASSSLAAIPSLTSHTPRFSISSRVSPASQFPPASKEMSCCISRTLPLS